MVYSTTYQNNQSLDVITYMKTILKDFIDVLKLIAVKLQLTGSIQTSKLDRWERES